MHYHKSQPTMEVFDSEFHNTFDVPTHLIVHIPPPRLNITRLVICRNYRPGEPSSCSMGDGCKFVHVDVEASSLQPHPIHVNYAYRSLEKCSYARLPAGETLTVMAPNERPPVDEVPSERVLVTRGSLMRKEHTGPLSHCAHYYFNRMCNRGERCNFIHSITVDPTVTSDFQRAAAPSSVAPLPRPNVPSPNAPSVAAYAMYTAPPPTAPQQQQQQQVPLQVAQPQHVLVPQPRPNYVQQPPPPPQPAAPPAGGGGMWVLHKPDAFQQQQQQQPATAAAPQALYWAPPQQSPPQHHIATQPPPQPQQQPAQYAPFPNGEWRIVSGSPGQPPLQQQQQAPVVSMTSILHSSPQPLQHQPHPPQHAVQVPQEGGYYLSAVGPLSASNSTSRGPGGMMGPQGPMDWSFVGSVFNNGSVSSSYLSGSQAQ